MTYLDTTYVVRGYLSAQALHNHQHSYEKYFTTEPGEAYSSSVRAEAHQCDLARQSGRPGFPAFTHITCDYVPRWLAPADGAQAQHHEPPKGDR